MDDPSPETDALSDVKSDREDDGRSMRGAENVARVRRGKDWSPEKA
jgi:hypothetical protein